MSQEPSLIKDASIGRGFVGNQQSTERTESSITPKPTISNNSSFNPTTDMTPMYGMYLTVFNFNIILMRGSCSGSSFRGPA